MILKSLFYPRRMRGLMRSALKLLAQLFQIPLESSGSCFHRLNRVHLRKVSWTFHYKRSLVITEAVCCDISESFLQRWKSKNPAMSCMQISLYCGLYCACATVDMVPLTKVVTFGNVRPSSCSCFWIFGEQFSLFLEGYGQRNWMS